MTRVVHEAGCQRKLELKSHAGRDNNKALLPVERQVNEQEKFSENISLMESLILAQNERWRRG